MSMRKCPYCNAKLEFATNLDDKATTPAPGDVGICFYCAGLLMYITQGGVRQLNDNEYKKLDKKTRAELDAQANAVRRLNTRFNYAG